MNNQDVYLVQQEKRQIQVELQTKKLAKDMVAQLVTERKCLGMTQQEIADATGIKSPNVARIESGRYRPTLNILMRYADALGKELQFKLVDKEK